MVSSKLSQGWEVWTLWSRKVLIEMRGGGDQRPSLFEEDGRGVIKGSPIFGEGGGPTLFKEQLLGHKGLKAAPG